MKKDNTKLIAGILFVFFFIIYLFTCQRDIGFTDAGELAGACQSLGIAHPTGYPLFTIIGSLWAHIPNPLGGAFWMNIFAAFCTSAAVAMLFILLDRLLSHIWKGEEYKIDIASALTAAFFGVSTTAWGQATGIEVYPLQMFMFVSVIYLFLKTYLFEHGFEKYRFVWAFILGLSFSNHMTSILLAPAFIFFFFKRSGEKFNFSKKRFKEILPLIAPFFLGLSLYMYLPIRAMSDPLFNWGGVSRSFDKFIYHVSGKQFQVWMFTGAQAFKDNWIKFKDVVFLDFIWTLFIPIFIGMYYAFKKNRELFYFILLLILGCLFYALNYSIHDIETYFSLAIIALFIFLAIGLRFILEKYTSIAAGILSLSFILALIINYPKMDESKDYLVGEYTNAMVNNLEPNPIIISAQWDYFVSAFMYKQRFEGLRADAAIIDQELLRRTWYPAKIKKLYPDIFQKIEKEYGDYMDDLELFESGQPFDANKIQAHYENFINALIDNNYGKRSIYITSDVLKKESGIGIKYNKRPEGFAIRLTLDTAKAPIKIDDNMMDKFIASVPNKTGHLENGIREIASFNLANIANYNLFCGDTTNSIKAAQLALKVNKKNGNASAILNRFRSNKKNEK